VPTQRWERFQASEADFAAFLMAHRDSLHPAEGLWTPLGNAVAQRLEGWPVRRMVVVRDERFDGPPYVGVYVSRRAPTRDDGIILLALTAPDEHGVMELRHVGPSLRRERRILVELTGDILTLVEPNGRVPLWHKSTLFP
jgi:hypothetical protein